ncbi:MAG: hypothetical protein HZA36_00665 [Parcubacteria group bacterium]|nr:hypothetical protein [Parcubacteria group bacterium]
MSFVEADQIYSFKFKHILRHVQEQHAKSLLDVGAGDSFLGLSLLPNIKDYVAVESDPERAGSLRKDGLRVLEGVFPSIEVHGTYDLVLLSQVMPKDVSRYEDFLGRTWNLVSDGGELVVVTFVSDSVKYNKMFSILSDFGEVKTEGLVIEDSVFESEEVGNYINQLKCMFVRRV